MNQFFIQYFQSISPVCFTLVTEGREYLIGSGNPEFTCTVGRMPEARALMANTSLALGEAYMRGEIEFDRDLYEVLNLFLAGMDRFRHEERKLKKLLYTSLSPKNQKEEVCAHYDIGNDFYKLWLDESMCYSCAYFKSGEDSLYQAQVNKVEHILDKLHLEKGMNLLDIGCGWGFLLVHAVRKYGVRGVGITLSKEQYFQCIRRIREEKLEGQIEVRLMDYRDLKKSGMEFDRAVSVGMLEHVGRGNYGEFMECISSVLKPEGLFLLHFISMLKESPGNAWVKKYIFPGGVAPSLREIVNVLPEQSFYTLDVESLRRHYNRTLLHWYENFGRHREDVRNSKGEEFVRMWEFYLASCAAAFQNGVVDLHQILMSKGVNNNLPMLRSV